jgi:hypothetical protein
MEKPRSWKTTNDTTYRWEAVARTRQWYDPLDGLAEGRQLARLDETKELLARDVGAHPVRHCDGEVLGELEVRAVATLWMRKNTKIKG